MKNFCRALPRRHFPAVLAMFLLHAQEARAGIKIRLEGNSFFGSGKIESALSPEPEAYSDDELREWREDAEFNIADLYRESGYFEAQVKADLKRRSEDYKDWEARITIAEGPRYVFDSVRVELVAPGAEAKEPVPFASESDTAQDEAGKGQAGRDLGPPPQGNAGDTAERAAAAAASSADGGAKAALVAPEELSVKPGKPYKENLIFQDRRLLLQRYGDAGYVRAKVDDKVAVKSDSKTVSVDFLVNPSYPVVFDTLLIRNVRATPFDSLLGITQDGILRGLVPYDRGDTVRVSSNDKVIEKLQYAGAFNFVRIKDSLLPGPEHRSSLTLFSEEHVPGNVRSALFYETQSGPGVSLDARHSNVAGTLNEVRTGGSLAVDRQAVYGGYGSPLTLGLLVRFDEDLSFNWDQSKIGEASQGLFDGDFQGLNSMRLTWPALYWLRLVGDVELEAKSKWLGIDQRERDLDLNFIQTGFLSFLNQIMDPTRGLRFAITWGNGGPLEKSGTFNLTEFRHNWIELQTAQYYYYPPLRQLKFATRLDGGRFFGAGGSNSDRFFLGGPRSVRGYGFQDLCPEKTKDGICSAQIEDTIPGATREELAYFLVSGELRVDAFDFGYIHPHGKLRALIPLQIVPFVDFGKVWDMNKPFEWRDPATHGFPAGEGYAVGLGIRYPLLGIFNLRVDYVLKGTSPTGLWQRLSVDLAQAF